MKSVDLDGVVLILGFGLLTPLEESASGSLNAWRIETHLEHMLPLIDDVFPQFLDRRLLLCTCHRVSYHAAPLLRADRKRNADRLSRRVSLVRKVAEHPFLGPQQLRKVLLRLGRRFELRFQLQHRAFHVSVREVKGSATVSTSGVRVR